MPEGSRSVVVRLALVVGLPLAASAAAISATHALEPGDPTREGPPDAEAPVPKQPGVLRIAGTGSALPLVRELAAEFQKTRSGVRVTVEPSIGSRGGVQATADGAVDIGLTMRPLADAESELGLVALPLARSPIVLAANRSVPDDRIDTRDLRDLIDGSRPVRWSNGHRALFVSRERDDTAWKVLGRMLPIVKAALAEAPRLGRWRVVYFDDDMEVALEGTPDAVGLHDLGAIGIQRLDLKVVRIGGLDPTAPEYPYFKELHLLTRGTAEGLAAEFIALAHSAEGRRIAAEGGYRP